MTGPHLTPLGKSNRVTDKPERTIVTAELVWEAIRRRWYLAVVCLAGLAWVIGLMGHVDRTYWAQTDVLFVEPGGAAVASINDAAAGSLIEFSGLVARKVADEGHPAQLPSPNVTLYGSGVRKGYSVEVTDTGTQWAPSYSQPKILIQATGDSPDEVRRTLKEVTSQIREAAMNLQQSAGARMDSYIMVNTSSEDPPVADVGSTRSGRAKGLIAFTSVGLVLTVCAAWGFDQVVTRNSLSRMIGGDSK